MAITEENGGIPATMLVSPSGYGNNGGMFGMGLASSLSYYVAMVIAMRDLQVCGISSLSKTFGLSKE